MMEHSNSVLHFNFVLIGITVGYDCSTTAGLRHPPRHDGPVCPALHRQHRPLHCGPVPHLALPPGPRGGAAVVPDENQVQGALLHDTSNQGHLQVATG